MLTPSHAPACYRTGELWDPKDLCQGCKGKKVLTEVKILEVRRSAAVRPACGSTRVACHSTPAPSCFLLCSLHFAFYSLLFALCFPSRPSRS